MTLKAIIPHVVWTIFLLQFIQYSQSFDLVSSLLSKTPNLADKLPLPNLKSLIGSSEAVQKLLQAKGLLPFMSGEATPTNPMELNRLLAQLKPKQGRFDPQILDMLSAFDNNYSGQIPSIFGNSHESISPTASAATISRRIPTSTEESGIIWSATPPSAVISKRQGEAPRKTVPNVRNRFSSKFRNKTKTEVPSAVDHDESNPTLTTAPPTTYVNSIPFDHITDPNIRNHRLYDWEFETYKNFTHIDQAEDLMADESDPSEAVVVKAPSDSSEVPHFIATTTIPRGWIPKPGSRPKGPRRPGQSMEESQLQSSGGDLLNSVVPGTYVKFPPTDSEEPKPPREPLRESSTENLIFTHSSSEDRDRVRYSNRNRHRDRSEENKSDDSSISNNNRFDTFRPSPPELSPPVFVDPDQDFFTSTIRNPSDKDKSEEYQHSSPGFRPPPGKRNRKRYRDQGVSETKGRRDKYKNNRRPYSNEEQDYYKKPDRDHLERNRDEISSKPGDQDKERVSEEQGIRDRGRNRDRHRHGYDDDDNGRNERTKDRPGLGSLSSSASYRPANSQEMPRIPYSQKSDRILSYFPSDEDRQPSRGENYNPDAMMSFPQGTDNHQYFQPQNPYGSTSNELGLNGDPNYMNNQNANPNGFYDSHTHPNTEYTPSKTNGDEVLAGSYNEQYHHPFAEESHSVNQYHGDESSWSNTFFILGGLIALSALSAFLIPTLLSTMGRQGKHRHDLTSDDLDGEYNDENTSTATATTTSSTPSTSDPTADADLWTEIKGVYNDVVNIVRGDYGGIVDKLTGNSKDKDNDGPNIVYRDEDGDFVEDDDEKYEDVDITKLQIINRNKNKNKNKNNTVNTNKNKNKLKNRRGNNNSNIDSGSDGGSDNEDDENDDGGKSKKKNRTISSTINYRVKNNGYPAETSRGSPGILNNTMAGFHLANSSTLFATSTENFMGEWAKVQLIGN